MVKTIKSNSSGSWGIRFNHSGPALRHLVRLPQAVLMPAANQNSSVILMQNNTPKEIVAFYRVA